MMIRDMMMTYGGDEVNQSYVELLRKRLLIEKEKSVWYLWYFSEDDGIQF